MTPGAAAANSSIPPAITTDRARRQGRELSVIVNTSRERFGRTRSRSEKQRARPMAAPKSGTSYRTPPRVSNEPPEPVWSEFDAAQEALALELGQAAVVGGGRLQV